MQSMPFRLLILAAAVLFLPDTPKAHSQVMPRGEGRKLAPDALVVIEPGTEWADTFQGPIDLPLVRRYQQELDWDPHEAPKSETLLEMAKNVIFRTEVYCLEFAFKPMRMIEVPLQTSDGVEPKAVWYLLYRVRYLGGDLQPQPEPDKFNNEVYGRPKSVSAEWVKFFPTFKLDTLGQSEVLLDKILPKAVRAIARKERVGAPVYDSVQIQNLKIRRSSETGDYPVWGVATWVDVDPRTDFFSVQVRGLSNAQKVKQEEDGELSYLHKTLVLHFWRAGDAIKEIEDRIRFGVPAVEDVAERQSYYLQKYGIEERLDYFWTYR